MSMSHQSEKLLANKYVNELAEDAIKEVLFPIQNKILILYIHRLTQKGLIGLIFLKIVKLMKNQFLMTMKDKLLC